MKRIFISDRECGEDLKEMISWCAKNELEIKVYNESVLRNIPQDFDLYLIHLSETTEEALENLRKEQPWCKIVGIRGASRLPEEIRKCLDLNYYLITGNYMNHILNVAGIETINKD